MSESTCVICGEEFSSRRRDQVVCGSDECHRQRVRQTAKLAEQRRRENSAPCSVDGCDKQVSRRGLCGMHYQRLRRYGHTGEPQPKRRKWDGPCSVDGCEQLAKVQGMCQMHYARVRNTGDAGPAQSLNRLCIVEGCNRERLCRGYCNMHYDRVRKYGNPGPAESLRRSYDRNESRSWTVRGYRRIVTPDGRRMDEHRYVMEQVLGRPLERFENVHHINGVRNDNRPENLELWTKAQPAGQRPEDLAAWVVEHYRDIVLEALTR